MWIIYGSYGIVNEDVFEVEDCEFLLLIGDFESLIEEVDRGFEEEMVFVCIVVRLNFEF